MRKISIFLVMTACLCCCSCSSIGGTAKDDRKMLVSAIGFDKEEEKIKVSVELIVINTENFESNFTPRVMSGTGKTIREGIQEIDRGLTRSMLFNHCGIIAIGEKIDAEQFDQICEYCLREQKITLSAYMISTTDCKMLLDGQPESSVTVGYDIMGIIEQESAQTGVAYNSRFFEVEALRERGESSFALPHFTRVEVGVAVDGMRLFHHDEQAAKIDTQQASMYAVITGGLRKGSVSLSSGRYKIASRHLKCSKKDGGSVTLQLCLSGDTSQNECRAFEKELQNFCLNMQTQTHSDIFGFEDILKQRFQDYDPTKTGGYPGISFTAECTISKGVHDES